MAYEQRDNSGSLFKNDKRETEKHPNATGKAMIDGKMYWVSAWTKEGASGKFQSLSFKLMEEAGSRVEKRRSEVYDGALIDESDIPF